jgi:hypothetical protein
VRVAWILVVCGCSFRSGTTSDDTSHDGGDDAIDAVTSDAPLGPFGPPTHLVDLGSAFVDDDPTLSPDMLEMYFASGRPAGAQDDIYVTTRAAITEPWLLPVPVATLNAGGSESEPELSADGLTIRISRINGGNLNDIYQSSRVGRGAPWTSPVRVPQLSSVANDYAATEEDGKLILVLSSERAGGGNEDLYLSRRATPSLPWGTPMPIAELDSPDTDSNPFLFDGGAAICFDTTRNGGHRDLYIARRPSADAPFGPIELLEGLSSPSWDADCWLSPDRRTIYFASERSGNREIYTASR